MSEEIKPIPSLKSQSAWLLMAKFVGYFFAFLLPLLVVRFLTQEEVGTYRLVFQIIVNAVGILPLGFSLSAYYFLARSPENRARTILNILIFNFVMGGLAFLVLFFYPEILGRLLKSDELTRLAPLAGLVIWLWILGMFLELVAVANREPKIATAFIILAQATKTLLMTAAVVAFQTVDAILYAALVQSALQILVLLFYLSSRFPRFWTSFDPGFFKKQMVYALPFGFAGVLWILQTDIHNYFVAYRFGEVGFAIYAYGCFEFPLITMIYEAIASVLIPKMSEFQSQGRTQDIIDTNISAMNKIALAYLPIFFFLMIVADTFIVTLFTEKYAASIPVFRVNLLLLPVYIVMLDPIARSYEEVGRFLLKFRIFLLAAIIAALWFGIQYFDLTGMISIVVVSIVFERIVTFIKIKNLLGLGSGQLYLLRNISKTAVAAFLAGIVLLAFYLLTRDFLLAFCLDLSESVLQTFGVEKFVGFLGGSLYLAICLAVFAPVYLLLVKWFNLLDDDEKEMLKNGWQKLRIFSKKIQNPKSQIRN
jgi:O-antigen/teichoic acid export membrane protein